MKTSDRLNLFVLFLFVLRPLKIVSIFGLRTFASGGKGDNVSKNRVLVVSPLGYTGLAYYDYSLCQSLSEKGLDVELCTSDKWILGSYQNTFRLALLYRCCSGEMNKVTKGVNYILSSFRILFHVLKSKAKVVHFQIVEFPLIDMLIMVSLKLFGKQIIFTPHDIFHNKKYPFNKLITSKLYSVANFIVVHKDVNKETLMDQFGVKPDKIRIIPHGSYEYFVDGSVTKECARKFLDFKDDYKIILFFGNIKPGKGIEILIKAMPLIRDKINKLRLVIAGRLGGGMTEEELLGALEKEGVRNITITKLEFIPEREIVFYYMASDIVVLPYTHVSESGVLRYAQSCGKTVVCSDLEEFKDTVVHGETGYLFRNKDYKDLTSQVILAFSEGKFERIGGKAKKLMEENYTWRKIASLTKTVYDDALKC